MKRFLLLALTMSSLTQAQNDAPRKFVRFLPLGELPVWEETFKDGVRVQKPPPKGSLPPGSVTYSQGEQVKALRFSLRSMSDIATFPSNAEGIVLKEGEQAGGEEFIRSKMPSAPMSLGVLFRDNDEMTWEQPRMVMLADDANAFPAGQMRFVNTSHLVVIVHIAGSKPFGLAPGKVTTKSVKLGDNAIKVGYKTADGGSKAIWQNTVKVGKGDRVQCFFYKAQGKDPSQAVRFLSFPEAIPKPPRGR